MAKVSYYGDHGVTFIVDGVRKHTWEDWRLVPVPSNLSNGTSLPQPKTNYKDIPGSDGQLDYTAVLAGLKFQMRQGSWEFYIVWNGKRWADRISEMLRFIQGKQCKFVLDDDPKYYYIGRVAFEDVKPGEHFSTITIDYLVDPYKYPMSGTSDYDWPWDNLVIDGSDESDYYGDPTKPFGNIIYGIFDVSGSKERTLINNDPEPMPISFTVSSDMRLFYNGDEYELSSGPNPQVITIDPGENIVELRGYGRVNIDYGLGKVL